ncbi:MAG: chain length determinant protein EpsF [Burkholderiales bacterium]|nr:MAG: chain length determinant protein EpsF [Burkholderiales bacterium]
MSFNQFLSIIKARWIVFTAVMAATVLLTVVVSLMLPKRYTAKSEVVIDVKTPDPIAGIMLQGAMVNSYMGTQVDIIESDRVAVQVVKTLGLDRNPEVRDDWMDDTEGEGDIQVWLASKLKKQLDIKPGRDSNVIEVSYTAQDARAAAAIANTFVKAYIDTALELRTQPAKQYGSLFGAQAKQLKEKYEAAQAKLSAYQREHGLIDTDEHMDIENARLAELSTQLVAVQTLSQESMSRKAQSGNNTQEVLNNPVVASLKADLARQEARLQETTARYGAAHPSIVELQANINELRHAISAETKRVADSNSVNNTVNLSRVAQLKAELEAQREKVLMLKKQRDAAMVLLHEVDTARAAYDAVQSRLTQTNLESQANQTDIAVLTPATPPAKPSGPKILLNAALSIVLGGLLALGVVQGMELANRRLRTPEDLSETLKIKLLAVVPDAGLSQIANKPKRLLLASNRQTPKLAAPGN